jgi:hypothetical protein
LVWLVVLSVSSESEGHSIPFKHKEVKELEDSLLLLFLSHKVMFGTFTGKIII